ncbi:hypothetical protein P3T76_013720 [Phytophthora citrophthora]|uniref:Necrosis inducing-like protein NPP1 type n=1 Tax=Phytophthora citrophthora TaxID=4793 RepID=A0AAD9G3C0_9STRA|nr:hypothetical protein P3T76_013720 [Phytophthora citrophthora]
MPLMGFAGAQRIATRMSRLNYRYHYVRGSNTTTRFSHTYPDKSAWIGMLFASVDGESQDLIMWNQLTDEARAALESANFEDAQVPFNDKNFETKLQEAWPF